MTNIFSFFTLTMQTKNNALVNRLLYIVCLQEFGHVKVCVDLVGH